MRPGFPERGGFADRFKEIDRRLAALERAQRLTQSSIGSGGLKVKDDGSIQFLADDGTVILEIDKSAFTFDRANGTRQLEITPAGGMKIYDTDGTTELIALDSNGLEVIGGYVTPVHIERQSGSAVDVSLSTTTVDVITLTFTPPPWAQTMFCLAYMRGLLSGSTGQSFQTSFRIDTGATFGDAVQHVASGNDGSVVNVGSITEANISLPSSFTFRGRAVVTGTNSSNEFEMAGFALYGRTPS